MNPIQLLPDGDTLNYFCTWATQNYVCRKPASVGRDLEALPGVQLGTGSARDRLNEPFLFGTDGVAHLWENIRASLYLVLDDGWDVPYGTDPAIDRSVFGSLAISKDRFPSLVGTPAERLKQMNDRIKAVGWRGAGIWVSPQKAGMKRTDQISLDEMRAYWSERIRWSRYAGVRYWKVDWGLLSAPAYRKCLTELAADIYPELYVEQAKCTPPLNGIIGTEKNRFADVPSLAALTAENYENSRVFRTYDVTDGRLSAVSTLDRLSFLLSRSRGGFLNCEDELYIGAALGCAVGIMRSPFGADRRAFCRRLQEATAAVRWSSIAPPFAGGSYAESSTRLNDKCHFEKGDTWFAEAHGKDVTQSAPAVMARNAPLPEVHCAKNAPFVICSHHPNGAYAIAAIRRYQHFADTVAPDVCCQIGSAKTVGIFGSFATMTLHTDTPVSRVLAQSLFDMQPRDITAQVKSAADTLVLHGNQLLALGRATDESEPAVMLTFLSES